MAPAGARDGRPAEPPHRRQGRTPRRLISPAPRMTGWRPPPGSAEAGRAGQPRLFPASITGRVMPWRALGAGTLYGVRSGPVEVLTARHVKTAVRGRYGSVSSAVCMA